jgi:hypothetical protein
VREMSALERDEGSGLHSELHSHSAYATAPAGT